VHPRGDVALWLFVAFLIVVHALIGSMPARAGSTLLFAAMAFILYGVLAALAAVERLRR
jgi:hypothetical protein